MFCLNRKRNLKRHNINYLDWPFAFKVNLKGSRPDRQPLLRHSRSTTETALEIYRFFSTLFNRILSKIV